MTLSEKRVQQYLLGITNGTFKISPTHAAELVKIIKEPPRYIIRKFKYSHLREGWEQQQTITVLQDDANSIINKLPEVSATTQFFRYVVIDQYGKEVTEIYSANPHLFN